MPPVVMQLDLESFADSFRFRATAANGKAIVTDTGEARVAPNPVELLLVALAGCHGMDIVGILRKKRQQVATYRIEVSGERREEHPRRFTRIELVHRLTGTDVSERAVAEAVALSHDKYCSVYASLRADIDVTNRIEITPA